MRTCIVARPLLSHLTINLADLSMLVTAGLPVLQGGLAADIRLCGLGTTFLGLSFLGHAPIALESLRCSLSLLAIPFPLPSC